jgi:acetyl-CoA carboxylase biotin carboxyl carrier protein
MGENTASAKADKGSGEPTQATDTAFDMDELRELMELVNEQGFTDFEFENENIRVRLSKSTGAAQPVQYFQPNVSQLGQSIQSSIEQAATAGVTPAATEADEGLYKITSPIVGTFYRSPGPDKEPYIKEGSIVSPESVVCIVEAMKLMNEIQAEVSGEVVKIYVENGEPVEFGQPLFGIKK